MLRQLSLTGLALAAVLGASTLAACGSGSHVGGAGTGAAAGARPANSGGNGSYVGQVSNAVVFVRWTRSGEQLSGTLYRDIESSHEGGEPTVNTQSAGFTGAINGSSVTLALSGESGESNLTGTLNGSELDLDFPGTRGGVATIKMHQATGSTYNQALEALKEQASRGNEQQQAAKDAQAVATDLEKVEGAPGVSIGTYTYGAGGSTSAHLTQMRHDLAATLADEQKVLGKPHSEECSSDADTVWSDSDTVSSDADTIEGEQYENGASAIEEAISQLQKDATTLNAVRASAPASAPSEGQVSATVALGEQALHAVNGASAGVLAQVKQMVSTANGYAERAQGACG